MGKSLRFKLLGAFRLIDEENIYDLEEMLGRQLSNIFALFIFNYKSTITKQRLIDTYWKDSENPANALKYAIHRLRNKLNEIEQLKDIIITSKAGYLINPEYDIEVDCLFMEQMINKAKVNKDYELIQKHFDTYDKEFLINFDSDWINYTRTYYDTFIIDTAKYLHDIYIENKDYVKAKDICYDALHFDEYNENIIYNYISDLIKLKNYNEALKYYDYIAKKYQNVIGESLDKRIADLFKLGSTIDSNVNISFKDNNYKNERLGPLECDIYSFKKLCELEYRNHIRNNKIIKVVTLEIKSDDDSKYMEILSNIITKMLRLNDIFARNGVNKISLILELSNNDDEYIVIKRLLDKFYGRVNKDKCRINYYIQSIQEVLR